LQVVVYVPDVVSSLRQQDTKASLSLLDSLVELIDCLMFQHPGFPDLYEPVVDALKVRKMLYKNWCTVHLLSLTLLLKACLQAGTCCLITESGLSQSSQLAAEPIKSTTSSTCQYF